MDAKNIKDLLLKKAEADPDAELLKEAAALIQVSAGVYQCFHCLHQSVVWQSDYSFEDFDYEGEGIVQILECANCGAEISYTIRLDEEDLMCLFEESSVPDTHLP